MSSEMVEKLLAKSAQVLYCLIKYIHPSIRWKVMKAQKTFRLHAQLLQ